MRKNIFKSIIASIAIFGTLLTCTSQIFALNKTTLVIDPNSNIYALQPSDYAAMGQTDDSYASIAAEIMNYVKTGSGEISLNCSSYEEFKAIQEYINQEYYGYQNILVTSYQFYDPKGQKYKIDLDRSRANFNEYIDMKNICNAIVDYLELDGKTDSEKVYAIANYMSDVLSYDEDKKVHPDVYCLYEGKAICGSYAGTFACIADAAGLKVQTIYGDVSYSDEPHAWNRVAINDTWYYIDVTNYDSTKQTSYILSSTEFDGYIGEYVVYSNF